MVTKTSQSVIKEEHDFKIRYDLATIFLVLTLTYTAVMAFHLVSFKWATAVFLILTCGFLTKFARDKAIYIVQLCLIMSFGLNVVFTQIFGIELP